MAQLQSSQVTNSKFWHEPGVNQVCYDKARLWAATPRRGGLYPRGQHKDTGRDSRAAGTPLTLLQTMPLPFAQLPVTYWKQHARSGCRPPGEGKRLHLQKCNCFWLGLSKGQQDVEYQLATEFQWHWPALPFQLRRKSQPYLTCVVPNTP